MGQPHHHVGNPAGLRVFTATIVFPSPEDRLDPPERETEWSPYITTWKQEAPLRHERALIDVLIEQSGDQPWWLGYLNTSRAGPRVAAPLS